MIQCGPEHEQKSILYKPAKFTIEINILMTSFSIVLDCTNAVIK